MEAFSSKEPKRQKFALFVLDDIVEHLGPAYFSEEDFSQIVQTVCNFVNNKTSSIRQAASYGIGVVAQHSGSAFKVNCQACLVALKTGIEMEPTAKVTEKKIKLTQFHHARDNAIASLGKVLKHQNENLDAQTCSEMIQYWLKLLPIKHDIEEAQMQYDFLADFVLQRLETLCGANPVGVAEQLAVIFGDCFNIKFFDDKEPAQAATKLKIANSVRYLMDQAGSPVSETFRQKCEGLEAKHKQNIENAYVYQGPG